MHINLGFLYSIVLTSTENHSSPLTWHENTITRDLNNNYHMFRHTFATDVQLSSPDIKYSCSCVPGQIVTNLLQHHRRTVLCNTCTPKPEQCTGTMGQGETSQKTSQLFDTCCGEKKLHNGKCPKHTQWPWVQEHSYTQTGDSAPERRPIRVATYNMWNLNSFDWEEYSDRMSRLGKVWYTHVYTTIISYSHALAMPWSINMLGLV